MFAASLSFVLGAVIASFVGVVVARFNTGEHILTGRSRCDVCGRTLAPRALIPIVSYLILRGRAACCGARLSVWSPIGECVLGVLFVLTYLHFGLSLLGALFAAALALMLALVLYDLAHQILPPSLLYSYVALGALVGYLTALSQSALWESVATAGAMALLFAFMHLASKGRAMGLADAPFVLGSALLVGEAAFAGFLFSFWIGAIVGVIILAYRPKGSRIMVEVPFAPFMAAGFLLAYFTQWNPLDFIARILS